MNDDYSRPLFPIYIVSKGRAHNGKTWKALDHMNVPYHVVVEEQELAEYSRSIPRERLLVLDKGYQRDYETCDFVGDAASKGPGAARNFAWDHAKASGYSWHWVMDDNIKDFWYWTNCFRYCVGAGKFFRFMEEFVLRYTNIAMAGPNYVFFVKDNYSASSFKTNTRIYSCNLIRNDLAYRWRGRYNEDTIISLDMLTDGWCTVLFNAFLQGKACTQTMTGGNTAEFYAKEGTYNKSKMLAEVYPQYARLAWRFGRIHHYVNY